MLRTTLTVTAGWTGNDPNDWCSETVRDVVSLRVLETGLILTTDATGFTQGFPSCTKTLECMTVSKSFEIPERDASDYIMPGAFFQHFKGNVVNVVGISIHTETEEKLVNYIHEGVLYSRPYDMFMEKVDKEKYPDAKQEYRFERI